MENFQMASAAYELALDQRNCKILTDDLYSKYNNQY
jgi:hypothetical protein